MRNFVSLPPSSCILLMGVSFVKRLIREKEEARRAEALRAILSECASVTRAPQRAEYAVVDVEVDLGVLVVYVVGSDRPVASCNG